MEELYDEAARELLRAIRGKRSQVAFARRLGYRANPITDWENGRRTPTMIETLRAADLVQLPVRASFEEFAPIPPPSKESGFLVHDWLDALRGSTSIAELARRTGESRFKLRRWLSGETDLKVPDFLRLLAVLTGRVHEWVGALVPIQSVPSLEQEFHRTLEAKRVALESPWSEAILRVFETTAYRAHQRDSATYIAELLGLDVDEAQRIIAALHDVGILSRDQAGFYVTGELSVDTSGAAEALRSVRQHWARVAAERLKAAEPQDWFAYNVVSVSKADRERIEQRLRAAYREVRAIVAQSAPSEAALLLTMQLTEWSEPQPGEVPGACG